MVTEKTPCQDYYEAFCFKSSYFFSPFIVKSNPINFLFSSFIRLQYIIALQLDVEHFLIQNF